MKASNEQVYSVSELTALIKEHLEDRFFSVTLEGEISNFRVPSSGHFYLTLKDDKCQIRVVMFNMYNRLLTFKPEDGMQVRLKGRISVYEPRGEYQILGEWMEPAGRGSLREAMERLKEKLKKEGLFDDRRKKKLPALPRKIAVITSPTGAAVRDILNVLNRRFSHLEVTLYPARVQGNKAAGEIAEAIALCNRLNRDDVIILTRGGGSLEDLWPFNEEVVARAISASSIPLISAVGHEIDLTISDFVADVRAPTPSAAAEIVIDSEKNLREAIEFLSNRLFSRISFLLQGERNRLLSLFESRYAIYSLNQIRQKGQQVDEWEFRMRERLHGGYRLDYEKFFKMSNALYKVNIPARVKTKRHECELLSNLLVSKAGPFIKKQHHRLEILLNRLQDLSPQHLLAKGYAICRNISGTIIKSADDVEIHENVDVTLHQGVLDCKVYGKKQCFMDRIKPS